MGVFANMKGGIMVNVEINSIMIATNFTSVCLAYKEKMVKKDVYQRAIQIHSVTLLHSNRK